jgi:hypothetical protein
MIKARPKYHTDLYDNICVDNIQKAVVIMENPSFINNYIIYEL